MKIYSLKKRQLVPLHLADVFMFFSKPGNLQILTPGNLGFQILTPEPLDMKEGAVIDYTIRLVGIQVRWTTLISAYDPPRKFVDIQLRGPYSFWHHTHTFTPLAEGTLIKDEVRYALPFGFIGTILHSLVVRRQLEKIFSYRAQIVERLFSDAVKNAKGVVTTQTERELV